MMIPRLSTAVCFQEMLMLKSEIQRKMEYISMGADMYEAGWKNNYKSDYIRQSCDFLRTTPQAMRIKKFGIL